MYTHTHTHTHTHSLSLSLSQNKTTTSHTTTSSPKQTSPKPYNQTKEVKKKKQQQKTWKLLGWRATRHKTLKPVPTHTTLRVTTRQPVEGTKTRTPDQSACAHTDTNRKETYKTVPVSPAVATWANLGKKSTLERLEPNPHTLHWNLMPDICIVLTG